MHMFFTPPFIELYGNSDNDNLDIKKIGALITQPITNQSLPNTNLTWCI